MAQDIELLRRQLENRKRLMEKINEIHSASSLNTILISMKDSIAQVFEADRMTIFLADTKRNMLLSRIKTGEEVKEITVPIDFRSMAGCCAVTGNILNIKDAYDDYELKMLNSALHFDSSWDKKTGYRTKQVLCVPMKFQQALIGVIQILNKKDGTPFNDADLNYATELATALSIAIYNLYRLNATAKVSKQKSRYKYLLDKNIIDEKAIEKATMTPDAQKVGIDQVLIRDFGVLREDMAKTLSFYFGAEFIMFDGTLPPLKDLLQKVKPERLKKEAWVPVKIENGVLVIAMEDPADLEKHDFIKFIFPEIRKISFLASFKEDIDRFIDYFYKIEESTEETVVPAEMEDLLQKLDSDSEFKVEEEVKKVSEQDSIIVQLVNKIIYDAYNMKASDIHVEPYPGKQDTIIRLRTDGHCKIYQKIPFKYKHALISRIKIMAGLDIAERRKPQDGKIDFKKYGPIDVELRVATVPTAGQMEDAVLRVLASGEPIPYDKLGLTPRNYKVFDEAINKPYGLVLVVGPTGSGKTTTLHSAIGRINDPETKIWTAEDPVEITQKGLRQVQMNAKIGLTFAAALRAFLRADPDVIMVGEMRDEETCAIGIESSLTGHLVFSTLHTNSAPETITRLLDMGMDPFNFSDALLSILAQRLARRLCGECKQAYTPDQQELDLLVEEYGREYIDKSGIDLAGATLYKPVGCPKCNNSGYKGRLGVHEILEATDGQKALIKKKSEVEHIRALALKEGMTTLKQDGIIKCFQGITDITEIRRVCIK